MKKLINALLLLMMGLSLTACTVSESSAETVSSTGGVQQAVEVGSSGMFQGNLNGAANRDTLVIYYSWSGNTQRIAERIARTIGADTYEIRTVDSYPENGRETAVIAMAERTSGRLPELVEDFPDLSRYTRIYIGAPIWNAYLPTPVESYLEAVDFTGKTVIPFSTSMGSGQTGFFNDFKARIQNPAVIGTYKDIRFPGNRQPNAYTDEAIDELLNEWLAGN